LEKEIGPEQFPVNEHYFGLVNVSLKHIFYVLCLCHHLMADLAGMYKRQLNIIIEQTIDGYMEWLYYYILLLFVQVC